MTELDLDALERMEKAEQEAWRVYHAELELGTTATAGARGREWRTAHDAFRSALSHRDVLIDLLRLARIGRDAENARIFDEGARALRRIPDEVPQGAVTEQNGA